MKWLLILAVLGTPVAAQPLTTAEIAGLPRADVVILGEIHDNPVHHLNQAEAIRVLRPTAIVWEMLTGEQAAQMPEDRDDQAMVGAALDWAATGWPAFALYFPIVEAAGHAAHYGAGVPRTQARRAFSEGAAAVFAGDAVLYGLTAALTPDEQSVREAAQFEAHCEAMPLAMMGGMVEAQRLRDAQLAQAAVLAVGETGGPVVVVTGNGHARSDWGVPAVLRQAAPSRTVVSVGQIEGEAVGSPVWDRWIVTRPHPRGDPCAVFE